MKLRGIAIAFLAIILLAAAHAAEYQNGLPRSGCSISTPYGLAIDRDCDGVDDFSDNCVSIPNPDQRDANRNSMGDACDVLVTRIMLDPGTEIKQYSSFAVRMQLRNNRTEELRDVQARVRSTPMDIDMPILIERLAPGEQRTVEFALKAPCIEPGAQELAFTLDYKDGERTISQARYSRIMVVQNRAACAKSVPGSLDNTRLQVIMSQDVAAGESAIFPITITNGNSALVTYHLSIASINQIGTYRIEPSPTLALAPNKSETVYLIIAAEDYAPAGRSDLTLRLEDGSQVEETTLALRVLKGGAAKDSAMSLPPLMPILQWTLIALIVALVIVAGIVAYRTLREPGRPKRPAIEKVDDKQEFESYY